MDPNFKKKNMFVRGCQFSNEINNLGNSYSKRSTDHPHKIGVNESINDVISGLACSRLLNFAFRHYVSIENNVVNNFETVQDVRLATIEHQAYQRIVSVFFFEWQLYFRS